MASIFKKISILFSLVLLYLTFKELFQLYLYLSNISFLFAAVIILLLCVVIIYFGVFPIFRILLLPKSLGPTMDVSKTDALLEKRVKKFLNNPYLKEINFGLSNTKPVNKKYEEIIKAIQPKAERIRKRYVRSVFYGTAVSQNGFLDAVIVLSAAMNLVKEIFILYNGRVSHKDLIVIWRNVYYSIVISGSDGVEYATEEVYSKLATDSMKSIPFFDKIFGSLTDGYVNAVLLTRISLITENYCTKIYITKQKELFPKSTFVLNTVNDLPPIL